jgi:hypothetical protein
MIFHSSKCFSNDPVLTAITSKFLIAMQCTPEVFVYFWNTEALEKAFYTCNLNNFYIYYYISRLPLTSRSVLLGMDSSNMDLPALSVCVCVCVCVHTRACVPVWVRMRVCVCARVHITQMYGRNKHWVP